MSSLKVEKIELNKDGVAALLKSDEMKELMYDHAKGVSSRCGSGYGAFSFIGSDRAGASVFTNSKDSILDNEKNNTILTSLGG